MTLKTIIVDRDKSENYRDGRWWNANPKARIPAHFRERGEVPEHLWNEYVGARKAHKQAEKEWRHAERLLADAFRPLAAPAPHGGSE